MKNLFKHIIFATSFVFSFILLFIVSNKALAADFPANPIDKQGWILDFNDEFSGQVLDTTKFSDSYLTHWTTPELSKANYVFENGNLVLKIDKSQPGWRPNTTQKISSVVTGMRDGLHRYANDIDIMDHHRAVTNYETKYGYFEIRARIQGGSGMHCAWWMVGNQNNPNETAEIDIFEILGKYIGTNQSKVWLTLHPWTDSTFSKQSLDYYVNYDLSKEFHVYGFEWDKTGMKFYFDNQLVKQTTQSPDYEMTTLLGMYEGTSTWAGTPDPNAQYPKKFEIDYFRAYKKPEMLVTKPAPVGGENIAPYAIAGSNVSWNWECPPSNLIDKNTSTCYQSKDNLSFPQYLYFDWNNGQSFDTVTLRSWYAQGKAPTNWDIEVSDDGETNWTTVANSGNVTWNSNNTTIESKTLKFNKVTNKKAMRIKINSANLSWKHYAINEVVIKDSTTECIGKNLASGAIAMDGSSNYAKLVDGKDNTAFQSNDNPSMPTYITLNWDEAINFNSVVLKSWYGQNQAPTSWDIEVSVDGVTNWTTVATSGNAVWSSNSDTVEAKEVNFAKVLGKKGLRIKVNNANLAWKHFAINEIEVYNK